MRLKRLSDCRGMAAGTKSWSKVRLASKLGGTTLAASISYSKKERVICGRTSGRYYRSTSFLLHVGDCPRKQAIGLLEMSFFTPFILIVILCNCLTMAWQSPLDPPGTWKADLIDSLEWVFLTVFTLELLLKVHAYGFAGHRDSYMRDAWCQLRAHRECDGGDHVGVHC